MRNDVDAAGRKEIIDAVAIAALSALFTEVITLAGIEVRKLLRRRRKAGRKKQRS